MSFWKRFGQQEKRLGAVLLLAGFLAGIACVCFFPGLFVQNQGFLDTDTLSGISEWDMNRTGLFLYCLQKRLGITVLFVLLALSGAGMLLEWCLHKKAASGVWISLAVIGIGCAVEGYVNPFILKAVMRLFWG